MSQPTLAARRAHIVYAHPEPASFVAAMRDAARETLAAAGWQVGVSDLYAQGFNPVASAADFTARSNPDYLVYALEQRHALKHGTLAADIRREIEAVQASELLVLVFPVFWFSMPAMLKGWIDRVFVSGLFYGGKRIYGEGGMAGKKALVLASLGGREHMFGDGAIHGPLADGMLRHLLQGTLGYVGYEVLEPFFACHVPYLPDDERRAILDGLRAHVAQVDALPSRRMPDHADFDDTFRPKAAP